MNQQMPFIPRRRKLPDRRPAETFRLAHVTTSGAVHCFHVTVGLYDREGSDVGEIFVNTAGKAGNEADVMAADAAVAVSLALQYGCPLEVLSAAMKRNPDGAHMGLLSHVLDEVARLMGRAVA